MKFSVLIAVYAKETSDHLAQSLESIFHQELPPDEVVLVEDGPLTTELDAVVSCFKEAHKELHIVKLSQNQGLGLALREGHAHCQYDIVARMDSDDISKPQRFNSEMAWLEAHPETDIVGCWTDEFADESGEVISTRRLPEDHEALLRFSRYRNPMNHPTVMFRTTAVEQAAITTVNSLRITTSGYVCYNRVPGSIICRNRCSCSVCRLSYTVGVVAGTTSVKR